MSLIRMVTPHSIGLPSIIHRSQCYIFLLGSERKIYLKEISKERLLSTLLFSVPRILKVGELCAFWFKKELR
jgi:hypothetical protein